MNYGGFWIRFLAYVVDSLIVTIGFIAVYMLLSVMGLELVSNELIMLVMWVLYCAFMQASARQATFGKALLGLKVGGLEGERISIGRSLGREVAKIVSALPLLIGFIIAGFTKRKQALHDFVATTTVVRAAPGHVVAGLAVAVVALIAPFIVAFMFGAGFLAGMFGGFAGAIVSEPQVAMQTPKPPAPKPAAPTPVAAAKPEPKPEAKPEPKPEAKPEPKPVAIPAAAPVVLVQAPAQPAKPPAAEPAKEEEKREPVAPKPAPAPKQEPSGEGAPPPAPRVIPGPVTAGPRFNDLTTAVLYGDPKTVERLLAFGKWPDKADSRGVTPLMLAAQLGDAASAEALLKAGADPNRPGPGGDTAASIARARRDAAMVELLQRFGGK